MTKKERAEDERTAALNFLRENLPPGETVKTILRHVSRSGMMRSISPIINGEDASWAVGRVLEMRFDQKYGGLRVRGCGMDMGFHLVYNLSSALYPSGFGCIGKGCPSNDHSNGDRDFTPHEEAGPSLVIHRHRHADGGYALRHRWL